MNSALRHNQKNYNASVKKQKTSQLLTMSLSDGFLGDKDVSSKSQNICIRLSQFFLLSLTAAFLVYIGALNLLAFRALTPCKAPGMHCHKKAGNIVEVSFFSLHH